MPPPLPPPADAHPREGGAGNPRVDQFTQYLARREQLRDQVHAQWWVQQAQDFSRARARGPRLPAPVTRDALPQRQHRVDPNHRRQLRREARVASAGSTLSPRLPAASTASSTSRPRATPSERYLRRSHARLRDQRPANMNPAPAMPDSLADIIIANPFALSNSATRPRSPTGDYDTQRRQTKRRKLDHTSGPVSEYDGFKYGRKGQVVPGRLKMDVVSCDGGEYADYNKSGQYNIGNVLKNDKSVYCSKSSRCNLLLKHFTDAPFALEKIVIKTPDRGFTAPVQQGLIFIAMKPDHLLSGTTGYNIEYESPPPRDSSTSGSQDDQQLSLREVLEDSGTGAWQRSRQIALDSMEEDLENMRLRSRRRQLEVRDRHSRTRRHDPLMPEDEDEDEEDEDEDEDDDLVDNCDYPVDEPYITAAGMSAPTPPPFTITTTESEEESEECEELPSAAIMADRIRRDGRWRLESDNEDDASIWQFPPPRRARPLESDSYGEQRTRPDQGWLDPIRPTRLRGPSRIISTPEAEGLIEPQADFFIARHNITIKFKAPFSGRYILLKLWSPTHDGNIDIESVQFYGYSGPRFFPAVQPC